MQVKKSGYFHMENFRLEDFVVDAPIGQGAFGQIYKASDLRSGQKYALKAVNRRFLIKLKKQNLPVIEKNALVQCASPFVIRLHGTFKDDSNLYFVFDLAEHGDLAEAVSEIGGLNTDVVQLLSAQLLEAICACHRARVIHRDLKPENVLLDARNHVKLTDFGTALLREDGGVGLAKSSIVGTPAFVAPELLNDGMICFASDLWAFGCTVFNLFTGRAPFEGASTPELMDNIINGRLCGAAAVLPRKGRALVDALLQRDPGKRLGAGESAAGYPSIRQHAFFAGVDWEHLTDVAMPLFTKLEEEAPLSIADETLEAGEKVVMEGQVDRRRHLSWAERTMVLTSKKRILLFNTKQKKLKAEMLLAVGAKVEVNPNGKDWVLTWGKGQSQAFRSKDGQGGMWAATILRESMKH
jgi:3-phosphoinositide dependent protein kinase-1